MLGVLAKSLAQELMLRTILHCSPCPGHFTGLSKPLLVHPRCSSKASFLLVSRSWHSSAILLWAAGGRAFGQVTLNIGDTKQVIWNKQLSVGWYMGEQRTGEGRKVRKTTGLDNCGGSLQDLRSSASLLLHLG